MATYDYRSARHGGFNERFDLPGRSSRGHSGGAVLLRPALRSADMTLETDSGPQAAEPKYLQWTPVIAGALAATAFSLILITFAAAVGTIGKCSSAEPVLSYELDRLFRAVRRPPNVDMRPERAEAGRILLTSSSHAGVNTDDRAYLVQLVGATTGLSPTDSERRVDNGIAAAKAALAKSRRSTIILAFSLATALMLGAVAAWAAACAGGRHRDGAPLPEWMAHSDRFARKRLVLR
jgi:hypothetical protein